MNRAAKSGVAGACAVLLGLGGVAVYDFIHQVTHGGRSTPTGMDAAATPATTPPSDEQAATFARAFLSSWSAGSAHYGAAAGDTDAPVVARDDLRGYHDGLKLTSLSFGDITATGVDPQNGLYTRVTYSVTARVAGGVWNYPGALDVLRSGSGQDAVHWSASVLYPRLQDGQSLSVGPVPAQAAGVQVLARDGRTTLTAARFPSLGDIVATIGQNAGATDGPTGGSGVVIRDSSGSVASVVKVFEAPPAASVTTTIDPSLQTVAESAVHDAHLGGKPASVVALDRRDGHILAIAYSGPDGDTAINARLAPGSTMKIIDAAALFDRLGMTPDSPAPCRATQVAAGQTFSNESDVPPDPNATIEQAFAESCNTAFVYDGYHYLVHGGDASVLHDEAAQVFGLGSWSIGGGVQTADPSIPPDPSGSDAAAQFIGQGQVEMSPLVLASVAATVSDGAFHQPVIVPTQSQPAAPRQISASTASYLRQMMRAVVVNGTATPRLGDLPDTGAKTGTAEVGTSTNGWLTAYNDNIAVAALVEDGSSGVDSAGYVVRALLTAP